MKNRDIKEKIIALSIHIVIVAAMYILYLVILEKEKSYWYYDVFDSYQPVILASLAYLLCSFISFNSINNKTYMSTFSIAISLMIVIIICFIKNPEILIFYGNINPIFFNLFIYTMNIGVFGALVFSAIIPSLLLCVGILLKQIYIRYSIKE